MTYTTLGYGDVILEDQWRLLSLLPLCLDCRPCPRPARPPAHITLVDDVITRGSSCIGIVPHLHEAYPNATVHCFAVVRTISTGEVPEILAPIQGTITSRAGRVRRQP